MIKPIETIYKGYRFRSRLEARWAVFFDACGIEYQYEPEGFIGLNDTPYLPDFYLPQFDCYVEVKGTDEALEHDAEKIAAAIDFESTPCSKGLLILGDIPDPDSIGWGNLPLFWYLEWHKGIITMLATFYSAFSKHYRGRFELLKGANQIIPRIFRYDESYYADFYGNDGMLPPAVSTKCKWSYDSLTSLEYKHIKEAYTIARQARFEHGEMPLI